MASHSFFLRCIVAVIVIGLMQIQSVTCQDAGLFLSEMMKNYITKNTRYYTVVNGIPISESEGPTDNKDILSRISSVLPSSIANSPVLTQILEQDANSFPNSWMPLTQAPPSTDYQQSSHMRRRYGAEFYALPPQPPRQESPIITIDDIPQEFKIQSTMSF